MMSTFPPILLSKLQELEPGATFSGTLPRIVSSSGAIYFAKHGSRLEASQYLGEAESLKCLNEAAPGIAPRLLVSGVTETGRPYMISEYKDINQLSTDSASVLGKRLAKELHSKPNTSGFGFPIPTYCGVTKLQNGTFTTWHECYSAQIGDLLDQLKQKGGYPRLLAKGDIIRHKVIPKLLGNLQVEPVILHGDLWSGNAGVDRATGQPVIYDPASYFGHNEADLSIARMFGGFPQTFYTTYHEHRPKTDPVDQYDLRADLYELFHHLNHTLIFGGSYASGAEEKMDILIESLQ